MYKLWTQRRRPKPEFQGPRKVTQRFWIYAYILSMRK